MVEIAKDSYEAWFSDLAPYLAKKYNENNTPDTIRIKSTKVYDSYVDYCARTGRKSAVNNAQFGIHLKRKYTEIISRVKSNCNVYYIDIQAYCDYFNIDLCEVDYFDVDPTEFIFLEQ